MKTKTENDKHIESLIQHKNLLRKAGESKTLSGFYNVIMDAYNDKILPKTDFLRVMSKAETFVLTTK